MAGSPVEKEETTNAERRGLDMENYETPEIMELGSFGEETGLYGIRNAEEINWHFDTWS